VRSLCRPGGRFLIWFAGWEFEEQTMESRIVTFSCFSTALGFVCLNRN